MSESEIAVLDFFLNDTKRGYEFNVTDDEDNPIDLTGCTAILTVFSQDYSTKLFSQNATIDPDQVTNKGKVTYQPITADHGTKGAYLGELEITFPNSDILTMQDFISNVLKKGPKV